MTPTLAPGSIAPPRSAFRALVTGYVALLPYQFDTGDRMNFAPADVLLILALVLGVGHLKYRKTAWTVWHFGIALVFVTGSLVAALRFGGLERYELLNKAAGLVLPFVSYFVITSAVSEWNDIRRILRVFALSVVLENILAVSGFLAAYFFGVANPFARYGGLRLSGALLDPNAYGGLLVAALVICEGASWGSVPLLKGPALWICRTTLTLGILFTFSRSAWVALGLALLLVCVIRAKTAIPLALTVLIGAPCLLLFMGQRFMPIFEVMASRPQQVQGRFELIRAALEAFTRHPILGGGLGSFRLFEGEIAHNTAMWFLADFGLVGLAFLVGFLGWFFAKAWFAYRFAPPLEQPLALALLLAHTAMFGLAMGIEAFYQRHWWLVFALIVSASSLARASLRAWASSGHVRDRSAVWEPSAIWEPSAP